MDYKLVLLDIDDTLAPRDSVEIYPAMRRFIEALGPEVEVVLVTNQGGPPCHNAGWSFSKQFPSQEKIQTRLDELVRLIYDIRGVHPALYVAWVYQTKNGDVYGLAGRIEDEADKKQALFFRKPGPGMILKAIGYYDVQPNQVVMIGDNRDVDGGAALAAGVAFRHVDDI